MSKYIFNARDVAAYFKYFTVPAHLEVTYMQHIFSLGKPILAAPLTRDFEAFKNEVYRELYYLWANGFENEKSDIANMPEQGALALICDQECITLECYMKLITLHLIFTHNLPYVNINFTGLPLSLGIRCEYDQYEANVVRCVNGLNLVSKDKFGKPFDLRLGVPDELLQISLSDQFRAELMNANNFREELRNKEKEKMQELRENSLKEFGSIPQTPASKREAAKTRKTALSSARRSNEQRQQKLKEQQEKKLVSSKNQPKGTPLEDIRHKDGK